MYLIKLKNGNYAPMDSSDHDESKKVALGDTIKASRSRNWQFHKKAFALLNIGFENQEKYESFEVYRKIITIKAGYFDEVEGKTSTYYLPKSLSYDKMKAIDFEKWYTDVLDVIAKQLSKKPDEIRSEVEMFY